MIANRLVRTGATMLQVFVLGVLLTPAEPAHGAQLSERDSVRALAEARAAVRSHIRQLRQLRPSARSQRVAREARPEVVDELDIQAEGIPGDDWIVGQRVGLRVMQGELDGALETGEACQASRWWCEALRGFVLHVRGEIVEAEAAFETSQEAMPSELRCEWLAEVPRFLLGGGFGREFRRLPCTDQIEEEHRVWWLADPLYLIPGNDRRTEHYARMVAMELHHQWLELEGRRCSQAHHEAQVKQGWPDWWWSLERSNTRLGDASGYSFFPGPAAGLAPLESAAGDWSLDASSWVERYDPPYGPIYSLDQQTAFFRRGDRFLAAVTVDVAEHELDTGGLLDVGLVLSRDAGEQPVTVRDQTGDGPRYLFATMIPADRHLLSVEAVSPAGGAARSRFSHGLPDAPSIGLTLSDILLWDWSADVAEDVEAVLPRMLGSTRIHADRELGLFWEVYGAAVGDVIEISLSARRRDRSLFARLTDLLRITSPAESLRFVWSEGMAANEPSARGRTLALNLSELPPGRYTLELQAIGGGGEPAIMTKEIELYR